MLENKMTLGPIQQKWVDTLREYPERQWKGNLSNPEGDKFCCLGQGLCIVKGIGLGEGLLKSGNDEGYLSADYEKLGLRDCIGELKKYMDIEGQRYTSLSHMNDGIMTWPEIADYIEANPDNVSTKSV